MDCDYDAVNERLLIITDGSESNGAAVEPQIITALNWFEELKHRVPVP